jgi:flavoprotein
MDYQKLCPKSGHVLTSAERNAMHARKRATGEALAMHCQTCGRVVEVCTYTGTKRSLIYPIHMRDVADLDPNDETRSK